MWSGLKFVHSIVWAGVRLSNQLKLSHGGEGNVAQNAKCESDDLSCGPARNVESRDVRAAGNGEQGYEDRETMPLMIINNNRTAAVEKLDAADLCVVL
ncbi:12000_t:CDS:2, partial [Acaulospora colombiana]